MIHHPVNHKPPILLLFKTRSNKVAVSRYGGMEKLDRYNEAKRAAGLESVDRGPSIGKALSANGVQVCMAG